MKSHELAHLLLSLPDRLLAVSTWDGDFLVDGIECVMNFEHEQVICLDHERIDGRFLGPKIDPFAKPEPKKESRSSRRRRRRKEREQGAEG